ncbi:hypothetical protein H4R20_005263 [Coemansia guatemalensis]|uniref:Mitochondrial carrier n=1 Tax=Coemansia guatemalensis TaxID=2761395 RepID=A0A9W8HX27_9FUNG|nr:hypothetical protein H4R20_005263 [Coemansia guatemalensis]
MPRQMTANDADPNAEQDGNATLPQSQISRKQAGAVGATASAVRGLMLQPLYLWYRTPLKLFRPLRVDYLATARALLPQEVLSRRVSLRGSTLGMIANAVKQRGWSFVPRYVLQPMLANWAVGFALFTTYAATLPSAYARTSRQYSINSREQLPWYPPFVAGAAAGLAQSAVATPLDSLRVRFEAEDMVSGKYHSWWGFAKGQMAELGPRGLYRGFKLTLVKDTAGYAGFFGLFELIKNETIDLYRDLVQVACTAEIFESNSGINRLTSARITELRQLLDRRPERADERGWISQSRLFVIPVLLLPPVLGKPACVLFAGAVAALAYQIIDYPFERFRTLLYSEIVNGEIVQHTVAQHFTSGNSSADSSRGTSVFTKSRPKLPIAELEPYRVAWKSLVDTAIREYPHPVQGKVWRTALAVRYLYRGWLGVSLRSIPAASVGLLAYELLKSAL